MGTQNEKYKNAGKGNAPIIKWLNNHQCHRIVYSSTTLLKDFSTTHSDTCHNTNFTLTIQYVFHNHKKYTSGSDQSLLNGLAGT